MPAWQIALIVAAFMCVDFVIVGAVMHFAVQCVLEPLSRWYPGVAVGAGALRRDFESLERDRMNFGWCVHLAADDAHLHVLPAWLPRTLGAKTASVPWDAVEVVQRGRWRWRVKIAGAKGERGGEWSVPRWVGELVEGK